MSIPTRTTRRPRTFRNLGEDATLVEALADDVSRAVPAKPAVVDGINPNSGAALGA